MVNAWSYSSIKTFDQCPKKYYHLKVVKDVKDTPGEAAVYGTDVHEAAENYIKSGTPVPEKYKIIAPLVEKLATFPGDKHTELKLGLQRNDDGYSPCDFFDAAVWYRGIVDLLIVDGSRAFLIDYKTGKNSKYADMKQLDLMAGAVFIHFPEVNKINSALAYVVSDDFLKKTHVREELNKYLNVFADQLERLDIAQATGVWNAKTSPLCGWCPVVECAHYKPRRW
jgi:hypothetical protein